jgi:hypothetical protein
MSYELRRGLFADLTEWGLCDRLVAEGEDQRQEFRAAGVKIPPDSP